MTCFIPGLDSGKPFSISLHSWSELQTSKFTKTNFNQHAQLVIFEARIFIDGRLVASAPFKRDTAWPQLISFGFDFNRYGELENLKFPPFRSELLRQDYWSPADELGRIKIVISEGFPRDSITVPIERVKNLIAFSFQHAPIDILEASAIAWPNPSMWRRGPMSNSSMPVPTEFSADGSESHMHSPRRQSAQASRTPRNNASISFFGSMPNTQAFLQNPPYGGRPNAGDPTSLSDIDWTSGSVISSEFATTLTSSLLNQPMPAAFKSNSSSSPSSRAYSGVFSNRSGSNSDEFGINLSSVNPVATLLSTESSGEKTAKRSRHTTPASTRASEEEEPQRSTPRVRIGFGDNITN
ncbi:hypothetical protein E8E14_000846 [Neopestalotiopsis sp. 37M]|nr:hypothetical protein E8E14_000846 [Neopestalotiopsis sp. 37M]